MYYAGGGNIWKQIGALIKRILSCLVLKFIWNCENDVFKVTSYKGVWDKVTQVGLWPNDQSFSKDTFLNRKISDETYRPNNTLSLQLHRRCSPAVYERRYNPKSISFRRSLYFFSRSPLMAPISGTKFGRDEAADGSDSAP